MTALTHTYFPHPMRMAFTKKRDVILEKLAPRPCMLFTIGLTLAGLSLPLLMLLDLLQPGFILAFLGFAMTLIGGVLCFAFCGDVH